MECNGAADITREQWCAYHGGLNTIKGDPEVLEELGIPVSEVGLLRHAQRGA